MAKTGQFPIAHLSLTLTNPSTGCRASKVVPILFNTFGFPVIPSWIQVLLSDPQKNQTDLPTRSLPAFFAENVDHMLQRHRLNRFITSAREQEATDTPSSSFSLPVGMASSNSHGLPIASAPDAFFSANPPTFGQEGKISESPLEATNEAIPPIWGNEKLEPKVKAVRRKWKKPKDKPKRPLSAYNIFFQHERLNMMTPIPKDASESDFEVEKPEALAEATRKGKSGSGGFAGLTRQIAAKWNSLDPETRSVYEVEAKKEQLRYAQALEEWKQKKSMEKIEEEELKLKASLFTSGDGHYLYGATLEQQYIESANLHEASIHASAQQVRRLGSPNQSISNDYEVPRFLPLHYPAQDSIDDWSSFRYGRPQIDPLSHLLPNPDTYSGVIYISDSTYEPAAWIEPVKKYTHSESLTILFEQLDEDEQELLLSFRQGR